jgi:phosphatidate cytidylyltransferase
MSNLVQRLLLFFVAVPLLIAGIVFLPHYHHAVLLVVVLVFSVGSALELATLFKDGGAAVSRPFFALVGALIPLAFFASTFLPPSNQLPLVILGLMAAAGFAPFAFAPKEKLGEALRGSAALSLAIIYPGLMSGYIVLILSGLSHSTEAILAFAALVVSNDSLAWLFGITLGRRRNLVAVSPNKSLAGFIGGLSGSCGSAVAIKALFPALITQPYWMVALLGLVMGCAVIVGDLFESALKRSVGTKDSGSSVPGRGGFLDSFDSVLFSAPVFYAGASLFGLFS